MRGVPVQRLLPSCSIADEDIRSALKRSRTLHSTYKMFRRLPEVPISRWANFKRTASIFRVLPNTMLSAARLMNAYDVMEMVERTDVEGAVAECGVWAGGTIGRMASVSKRHQNHDRVFHLFDSFEGLPQPSVHDVDVLDAFQRGHPDLSADDGSGGATLVSIDAQLPSRR